jgi:hypothetical protein
MLMRVEFSSVVVATVVLPSTMIARLDRMHG